ncbi:hypothetical protein OPV22_016480 [Ensete ventricosum]|uniref:Uncharacterized protein n=1 Tax=Ensete ventricosum TaxID=4639 RepID=A0AAV8QRM9_ENSVE|nr:hypothetical protein OPV22_016480 [Ensete ventricosum]
MSLHAYTTEQKHLEVLQLTASSGPMAPNLELLLLALLHGAVISCGLLLFIILILITFLLASYILFLVIVAVDAYDTLGLFSWLIGSFKANLQLGLVLLLWKGLSRTVGAYSAARPRIESMSSEAKLRAGRRMNKLKNLTLASHR